ncbi:uncharacterized protein si:dkey-20d21.12 isoform X1 [Oncorhynchus mykiss]|uniref:uncharacterized protein si:dkey-20d21.12 isoform X1 n=1 Tax=Oncorhynchus mykiss TaxID=8022 RepID=UPI001877B383|nr:uncharacterized protein si:dkey-20d21.12 isoform X1 [Oncorhynchus mykiss]
MAKQPPSPTTPVFFTRISDRDLTEIELHSVESINDLHRTHPEHNHKGSRRPPLPPAPSTNGNLHLRDRPVVYQTGHPMRSRWQSTLRDLLMPTSFRYTMGCAVTSLTLLTLLLIFYFLAGQHSPVPNGSSEGETGCGPRGLPAHPGAAGAAPQPHSHHGRILRSRGHGEEHPSPLDPEIPVLVAPGH